MSSRKCLGAHALLLQRVNYRDSDLIATLLCKELGKVTCLARAARRSTRRFGGALEAMHTLSVELEERNGDLLELKSAQIAVPRFRLVSRLDELRIAGQTLTWVRQAAPERVREPQVWHVVHELLNRLDGEQVESPQVIAASAGLMLLGAFGWGLDFSNCVRCGKSCPAGKAAAIKASAGGLVCSSCGGARLKLSGDTLQRMSRATSGDWSALIEQDTATAVALTEEALSTHGGVD